MKNGSLRNSMANNLRVNKKLRYSVVLCFDFYKNEDTVK